MLNEGNQIHNFMSSSGSGSVINYSSGSGSGSGSKSQKVTVPTVPVPVPVIQHWIWGGAGEAVCPRVQPLLMVGWLITKDLIDGFYMWGWAWSGVPTCTASPDGWLIDYQRFDWWFLFLRRCVKRCAHMYSLSDGWLIDCQGLIDLFFFWGGEWRGVPTCTAPPDDWLIAKGLTDGFYNWGGAWSSVPTCTASPDGWLIDCKVWLMEFELKRGEKQCAHVYSLSWWLVDWLP